MSLKKGVSWLILIILIFGLIVLSGCGPENVNGNNGEDPISESVIVDLYFINSEYARTGDESLEHYLIDTRELQYEEDVNPWVDILNSLKNVDLDDCETAVTENVIFKDVSVSKEDSSIMIVDLGEAVSGGSMQESFFIRQIVKTIIKNGPLFQESSEVGKVQFQVKGEIVESLMGHFSASEPFNDEID